jgi:hypothetical protein
MYGTVDQKIVKFTKSPYTQVMCPQNDQPFEVTAKGVIMHDLYEAEFCEELFGPAPTPAPPVAAAQATPATTTTTTMAPALPANAGVVTTTAPPRNGVVPKDSTPVTAVQKAYANDLAGISTGQPATLDYENETWYLSRVINGGGARYVGTGGQCIFTVTPDKPAGAPPVVTYTPDKCINMDRLIDNWIRFPKTVAVPLPATTTTTAPRFGTNPVINGPEPVTAIPTPIIAAPPPVPVVPVTAVPRQSSVATTSIAPVTTTTSTPANKLNPTIRLLTGGTNGLTVLVTYTVGESNGVDSFTITDTTGRLLLSVGKPVPLGYQPTAIELGVPLGVDRYGAQIQVQFSDGSRSLGASSNVCRIVNESIVNPAKPLSVARVFSC